MPRTQSHTYFQNVQLIALIYFYHVIMVIFYTRRYIDPTAVYKNKIYLGRKSISNSLRSLCNTEDKQKSTDLGCAAEFSEDTHVCFKYK
jgi:hypothetical protein